MEQLSKYCQDSDGTKMMTIITHQICCLWILKESNSAKKTIAAVILIMLMMSTKA